jgi:hypothetical protein
VSYWTTCLKMNKQPGYYHVKLTLIWMKLTNYSFQKLAFIFIYNKKFCSWFYGKKICQQLVIKFLTYVYIYLDYFILLWIVMLRVPYLQQEGNVLFSCNCLPFRSNRLIHYPYTCIYIMLFHNSVPNKIHFLQMLENIFISF